MLKKQVNKPLYNANVVLEIMTLEVDTPFGMIHPEVDTPIGSSTSGRPAGDGNPDPVHAASPSEQEPPAATPGGDVAHRQPAAGAGAAGAYHYDNSSSAKTFSCRDVLHKLHRLLL